MLLIASLVAELEASRKLAAKQGQASAAVSATMGKAKILGLIIDRRETGDVGAHDAMTDEELVAAFSLRAHKLGFVRPLLIEDGNKKSR